MIISSYKNPFLHFFATEADDDDTGSVTVSSRKGGTDYTDDTVKVSSRKGGTDYTADDNTENTDASEDTSDTSSDTETTDTDDTSNSEETEGDANGNESEGEEETSQEDDNSDETTDNQDDGDDSTSEDSDDADGGATDYTDDSSSDSDDSSSGDNEDNGDADSDGNDDGNDNANNGNTDEKIKKYNLFRSLKTIYYANQTYIKKLNEVSIDTIEGTAVLNAAIRRLTEIDKLIYEYMTIRYQKDEYNKTLTFYYTVIAAIKMTFNLISNNKVYLKKDT